MIHDQVVCPPRTCSVLDAMYLGSGMMHDQVVYPPTGLVQCYAVCVLRVRNDT